MARLPGWAGAAASSTACKKPKKQKRTRITGPCLVYSTLLILLDERCILYRVVPILAAATADAAVIHPFHTRAKEEGGGNAARTEGNKTE